jgi:hypothetical protein
MEDGPNWKDDLAFAGFVLFVFLVAWLHDLLAG